MYFVGCGAERWTSRAFMRLSHECVADYAELSYAIIRRRWLASWQMAETCALLLLLA